MNNHVRRSTPYGNMCVTVVSDLMAISYRSGSSRLLNMSSIHSKSVSNSWPASQPNAGVCTLKSL